MSRKLQGHGLHQHDHPGLRGGVMGTTGPGHDVMYRGHADGLSRGAGDLRHHPTPPEPRAASRAQRNCGVVHQDVDTRVVFEHLLEHPLHRLPPAHVGADGHSVPAPAARIPLDDLLRVLRGTTSNLNRPNSSANTSRWAALAGCQTASQTVLRSSSLRFSSVCHQDHRSGGRRIQDFLIKVYG
jgi:hypothetical protein